MNPEPERDDDALLVELGEVLRMNDQPPADVIDTAKELFTWRTVDAELAALTFDSLLDDEPAAVRSTAVAPRVLTFETDDVTVELEVEERPSGRRLLGQLVPAGAAAVVFTAGGRRAEATADELGSFVVLLPDRPGHVVLTVTPHGARAVSVVAVV